MIESHLGADGLVTVPDEVLEALGLKPGDAVRYHIEDGRVTLSKSDDALLTDDELGPVLDEVAAMAERNGETFSEEDVFAELYERIEALSGRKDAA